MSDLKSHKTNRIEELGARLTFSYSEDVSHTVLEELEAAIKEDSHFFTNLSAVTPLRWKSNKTYKAYHLLRKGNYELTIEG